MRQISIIVFIFIALWGLSSCIEKYFPSDILEKEDNYVVSGRITNAQEYHLIKISKTSPITLPQNRPALDCEVKVIDSENNVFISDSSTRDGGYYVRVEQEFLEIGKAFKIVIRTPEGMDIESSFDTLRLVPDIKNLYVQRLDKPTTDPKIIERGVQFKVDLEADDNFGRFFNWEMEVTYEYRSAYPITHTYDGNINQLPIDYSLYYCWKTEQIKDFFPLSTKALNDNSFVGHNLHFVNNRTQKLVHQYSVLLYQSAISEAYFNFLDQVKRNSSDQEGLFGTQPITVVGNLTSTSHPETRVLGFFSVESFKSHRFFFSNVMDVPFEIPPSCIPYMPLRGFSAFDDPSQYPIYLTYDKDGLLGVIARSCIDCRMQGGGPLNQFIGHNNYT